MNESLGTVIVDRRSAGAGFSPIMAGLMRMAGISLVVRFDPIAERSGTRP